jgi:hypothetical protein
MSAGEKKSESDVVNIYTTLSEQRRRRRRNQFRKSTSESPLSRAFSKIKENKQKQF